MSLVLVGLNHKTAPVELRERLAFTDDACAKSLRTLVDGEIVREGLIVSTCNRVEVLAATSQERAPEAVARLGQLLSEDRSLPKDFFTTHFYTHADEAAVRRRPAARVWCCAARSVAAAAGTAAS